MVRPAAASDAVDVIRRRRENRDDATLGSLERSVPPAGHSTCTHCRSRSASRRVGFARTNSPWRSEAPRQLRKRTRSVSLYFSIMVRFSTEYWHRKHQFSMSTDLGITVLASGNVHKYNLVLILQSRDRSIARTDRSGLARLRCRQGALSLQSSVKNSQAIGWSG